MRLVRLLETKLSEPPEAHKLFSTIEAVKIPVKFTKNQAVPRLMGLCPRLPEQVAIKLIADYGSIIGVLLAVSREDIEVAGFGKTLQRRLRENVGLVA
jgi:DNA integrity scanning protein DisA with diadenylate cyclase activity